jgi:hypothetical protein
MKRSGNGCLRCGVFPVRRSLFPFPRSPFGLSLSKASPQTRRRLSLKLTTIVKLSNICA